MSGMGRSIAGAVAALVMLALGAGACEPSKEASDSNTNFLMACESDADCGAAQCLCGVCTLPCSTSSDKTCVEIPGSRCASADDLGGACDVSGGACLPACEGGDRCSVGGELGRCVGGACVRVTSAEMGAGGLSGVGGTAGTAGTGGAAAGTAGAGGVAGALGADAGDAGGKLCGCGACAIALEKCVMAPGCVTIAECAEQQDCHGEECMSVDDPDGGPPLSGPCRDLIASVAEPDAWTSFLGADLCAMQNGCEGHAHSHFASCVD